MPSFEDAHEIIIALIDDFEAHSSTYMSSGYSEAQARLDFIDKFWTALGWDVGHVTQKNPYEQEVRVERTVTVGGTQKKADYAFFVAPNFSQTTFFVEAKKPCATLNSVDSCFQIIRYSWNAGCPISVLHDFEELLIVDCRWQPDKTTAQSRVVKTFHYTSFRDAAEFRKIFHLFSHEAAADGAIKRYADALPKPKGRSVQRELFKLSSQTLDEVFLSELEIWRKDLAKGFKRANPHLDAETLTEITQRTLDRLVFLRFLEDKGIEQTTTVGNLGARSGDPWADFQSASRRLDKSYNGAIFRHHPELDNPKFSLSGDVFGSICEKLDSVNSPYDFNVIPIHILGSIYERFLGSVIIVKGFTADVDLKPEVRKAGGVYYTPDYVVQFIVERTVGARIEGKTPLQIESMAFADIACGSGSFLLGIFEYLLRYHTRWYNENPKKARLHSNAVYHKKSGKVARVEKAGDCYRDSESGSLRLTLERKRQILVNNIFGTDLDPQAVEVAHLSLYLKLLEDETAGTTHQYSLDFGRDALLPSLERNIVCGNALIGTDISGLFDLEPEVEEKLRPMDYETVFPAVFARGGFDAIVGNPPYLNIDDVWGKKDIRLSYIKETYPDVYRDKTDIYFYFIDRALRLGKQNVGYIVSRSFMQAYKGDGLRKQLITDDVLSSIIDFQNFVVFKGVGITTAILFTGEKVNNDVPFFVLHGNTGFRPAHRDDLDLNLHFRKISIPRSRLGVDPWEIRPVEEGGLIQKIDEAGRPLSEILVLGQGMQTGCNKVFGEKTQSDLDELEVNKSLSFQRARNSNILRYQITDSQEYLLYLEDCATFSRLPLPLQKYLKQNRAKLEARAAFKRGDCDWWRYTWPLHKDYYARKRLVCPYLATYNRFALVSENNYLGLTDTIVLFENEQPEDLHYLLGVLNSKLLSFRFKSIGKMKGGGVIEYFWNSVGKLRVKRIDMRNSSEKRAHDQIVSVVKELIDAKHREGTSVSEVNRVFWARKAETLDKQIDALVYKIYSVTGEEISLVESEQFDVVDESIELEESDES